jgi:hypothetical protein
MLRVFIFITTLFVLTACMPGYKWVNTDFSEEEMYDNYVLDKGQCMQVAGQTYPDPEPVRDPDELYNECMAYSSRRDTYPVRTEDGGIEYRTVTRRVNPWQCRPPRELREAYREYQNELRDMQMFRARHVNSCMSVMGWERIKIEDTAD